MIKEQLFRTDIECQVINIFFAKLWSFWEPKLGASELFFQLQHLFQVLMIKQS